MSSFISLDNAVTDIEDDAVRAEARLELDTLTRLACDLASIAREVVQDWQDGGAGDPETVYRAQSLLARARALSLL